MFELLDEYESFFHDSFPTWNFKHLNENEIVSIIKECLNKGDDVYTLGYLEDISEDDKF